LQKSQKILFGILLFLLLSLSKKSPGQTVGEGGLCDRRKAICGEAEE